MKHLTGAMAIAMATATPMAAETIDVTIVAGHPPIFIWVKNLTEAFIPAVDAALEGTGHSIDWNEAYGGSLAKPGGESDAVAAGLAQVAYNPTLFNPSLYPLQNVAYVAPFGTDDPRLAAQIVTEIQAKTPAMMQAWADQDQVFLGGGFAIDSYHLFVTEPVNSVADMEGRRICAPGPTANWIQGTGAAPVSSSLGEYYNSIQTGVCDGAVVFATAAAPAGIAEVAPYMIRVDFGAPFAAGLSANADFYEDLPEEVRAALHAGADAFAEAMFSDQEDLIAGAYDKISADGGQIIDPSEEVRQEWAAALPAIPRDWAARQDAAGLPGTEVLSAYMDALRAAGETPLRDWDKE